MLNKVKALLVFMALSFMLPGSVLANEVGEVAQQTFNKIQSQLTELKHQNKLTLESIKQLVQQQLLDEIDEKYFAYKVLGKHLSKLTAEQKNEFVIVLTQSLISNFANSLVGYNNEVVKLVSVTMAPSNKSASVLIKLIGQQKTTQLSSKWRFSESKQKWLMYDVVIEGVSLLQSKQQELAKPLAVSGVEATLALIKSKNTRTET